MKLDIVIEDTDCILKVLRETAMTCVKAGLRHELREVADRLDTDVKYFALTQTAEGLRRVNGLWTRALYWLNEVKITPDSGPHSDSNVPAVIENVEAVA
jgi:hypothetical protein